jgi:translocator protein
VRISSLITTSLATAAAAVVGSIASKRAIEDWYPTLDKPAYVPPNIVFPIAWTTLYADIAVTSASTIDRLSESPTARRRYQAALAANLVLNAGWSWLFFGKHKLGASAVAAAALTASSADLARRTAQINPGAGAALAAYPAWCGFATVMSTDIWRRNR